MCRTRLEPKHDTDQRSNRSPQGRTRVVSLLVVVLGAVFIGTNDANAELGTPSFDPYSPVAAPSSFPASTMPVVPTTSLNSPPLNSPPVATPDYHNPPLKYFGTDLTERRYFPRVAQYDKVTPLDENARPITLPWEEGYSIEADPDLHVPGFPGWPGDQGLGKPISEHKDGFFQKFSLASGWMDRRQFNSFGVTEVETFLTVAVPAPTREWPMLISPTYNVRFLDGPSNPGAPPLPPQLHEAFVDFLWIPRINDRLIGIIGVAPSIYSDFHSNDSDAFRLTGKGLARYDIIPERFQLLAGVLYLNRDNIKLLPAGGIYWKPTDDWNYELIFPKPKIARRLIYTGDFEDWLYVGAEFGGNTFAVERTPGFNDKLTLFDMRAYVGLERKRDGGAGRRLEIGYVFSRTAEYASDNAKIDGAGTFLIRGGVTF